MFSKKIINHIAIATGFIQRHRKLNVREFFFSLTFGSLKMDSVSLTSIVENLSTPISRAGVNKRFNGYACDFLQGVYSHLFAVMSNARKNSLPVDIFKKFKDIKILDSSSWKVPAALKESFPGYNQAGSKIQLMLSYKTGTTQSVDIGPETGSDQQYSKSMADLLEKNDLGLFDLGFTIPESLNKTDAKGAFFISRFNDTVFNIYMDDDPASSEKDILTLLNSLNNQKATYDIPCYVGKQNQRTKVRILAVMAPQEVANRRRQKLRAQSRKKGWTPKERTLELCNWTFAVTNIPIEKDVSVQEIFALYAIRWTIEIYFKQLKSILNIHKTYVKSNSYRLRAEILARSIVALFITYCFSFARSDLWRQSECEISFEKTVKYFKRHAAILMEKFLQSIHSAVVYIQQMIPKIILYCEKYRQTTRKNSLDKLIEQSLYENFKHIKINPHRRIYSLS